MSAPTATIPIRVPRRAHLHRSQLRETSCARHSRSNEGRDLTDLLDGSQDMSQWRDAVLMENLFIQEIHYNTARKLRDIPELNKEIVATNRSYRSRGVLLLVCSVGQELAAVRPNS